MMNQPDANYWLSLAAQWIQSKSHTEVNFPSFPFPNALINTPIAPEPPRISNHDATANDNLIEADMELEEKEESEPVQIWAHWQNAEAQAKPVQTFQQQPLPVVTNNKPPPQKFLPQKHQNNKNEMHNYVQIPSAPFIGQMTESVDMVLDSDAEEEDNSSSAMMMEAQKRKKLPVWIREGLERIEREKKLEEMRLLREKELQEDEEKRKKMMEEALKELEHEKISKSKYVS